MIIQPKVRGFICTTAHPQGCAQHVQQQIEAIRAHSPLTQGPKKVLLIGASTGYGLASRIAAAFGANAGTIGVFYERPAAGKRTASAGWYNTAAFEKAAQQANLYAKSVNGDAFSEDIKQETIELIKKDWGGQVDLVIYSLASPRRIDPVTGKAYNSVLKPIGQSYTNKTVNVMTGDVSEITIESASEDEIEQTIKVMGGEDWQLWIDALLDANVLASNVTTLAYSYIGPDITHAVYHQGTIGKAKEHLEQTAQTLHDKLGQAVNGRALISVNKALVTQSSAAIPVVPLYISLLYKVMKAKKLHEGCIDQMWRLLKERLYTDSDIPTDEKGRIRIDDWEMREDVQKEIKQLWPQVTTENLEQLTDIEGYRNEFYNLFGFNFNHIDYDKDVDLDVSIPSLTEKETTS